MESILYSECLFSLLLNHIDMEYGKIAGRVAKLVVPRDKVIEFNHEPFKDSVIELKDRRFKDGFGSLEEGISNIISMLRTLNHYADNDQAKMGLGVGKNTKKHIDAAILKLTEANEAIEDVKNSLGDA